MTFQIDRYDFQAPRHALTSLAHPTEAEVIKARPSICKLRLQLSQAFVSQIETGKREGSIGAMKGIADALSVTLDDLV